MALQKKGLGMGLGALMNTNDIESAGNKIHEVDINKINPNKNQPRTNFDEDALRELADSIEEIGIIQPLTVKKNGEFYEIIAGERRWRAARIAGLRKVPVLIKEYDDLKALEAALIENIQREDLNPMEEAFTYVRFSDEFNLSQEDIAKKVGKSRSAVANAMRLINLDARVQTFVKEGKISSGHGRTLLGIEDNNVQFELAEKIIDENLSVRDTEALVKRIIENNKNENDIKENKNDVSSINPEIARECLRISNDLKNIFGTKVNIKNNRKNGNGKIEIEYSSMDDLDRIVGMIKEKMVF